MVFESLVTDLVNRFLGDYIENLDKSQLKIGIWGGDVVLKELFIKESALDDLDLPVKIIHGSIGSLVLKIPWKNLYTEPVIANLDGLYLVACPNQGVKYDAAKEEKSQQERKQKELQRIDEAKKLASQKNKPDDKKADSFGEKMATQVIKNLQVNVRNIHVRYEDRFTNPKQPFSIGVTLNGLAFQTTDEDWNPTVIKDTVQTIYKMVNLDSLAVYWNSNSQLLIGQPKQTVLEELKNSISSKQYRANCQYLIEPISSVAKLRLNTKPENMKFSMAKVFLDVVFQEIAIALTKKQYNNVLELLEAFERMNMASMYRKYRPDNDVGLKGNSKHWWHFAYKCILEEVVRRRRKMWSWEHIRNHRKICKEYKEAWKKYLINKKPGKDLQDKIEQCEKELNIFNITLCRNQAEVENKKAGAKKAKEKAEGGWFGGWFGGGKKKVETKSEEDITDQFYKAMSSEEKNKLYDAIGYEENAPDPTLPIEFEANKLHFALNKLSLSIKDSDKNNVSLMKVELTDVIADVAQRPAANAVKVGARMDSFNVIGYQQNGVKPVLVSSQTLMADKKVSLLDVQFETNPLDGSCDQLIKVLAQPTEIIYDACTINAIAEFFKPPESVYLKQLQAAAMSKFEQLKEQTTTGLQYAIEQHKYTDISVDLKPSYVLMPDKGVYRKDATMLVLDLGNLTVNSAKREKGPSTPSQETVEQIRLRAYDKFRVKLQSVQLLFAKPGDDWRAARLQCNTDQHILRPMAIDIDIHKCIIPQDFTLSRLKVMGELPLLSVNMSDQRLHDLLALIQSIPFPEGPPPPPEDDLDLDAPSDVLPGTTLTASKVAAIPGASDSESSEDEETADDEGIDVETQDADKDHDASRKKKPKLKPQNTVEQAQITDIELRFEVKEICLHLSQMKGDLEVPILKVVVESLGTQLQMRSFDMVVDAYLGGVFVQHLQFKATEVIKAWQAGGRQALSDGPLINLVNTPITDETTSKLLSVQYIKANKKNPEFATTYNNTEQKVSIHFTALEILLHQAAILNVLEFAEALQPPAKPVSDEDKAALTDGKPAEKKDSEVPTRRRRRHKPTEIIDIAVDARLDLFSVAIVADDTVLADIKIKGLEAGVEVMKSRTSVRLGLKDIIVYDPTRGALHPKILSIMDGEVLNMKIVVYNGATEGEHYSDMLCVDTAVSINLGCIRVVFLNKFVNGLLGFVSKFDTAKDKVKEASSAVAESAAAAAQDVQAKASRVALDISMKAPLIIIPQNSTSDSALMADLGTLVIKNEFSLAGRLNEQNVPAILDKMKIELTALKVSRAVMCSGQEKAECLLVEPVTVMLTITRNLSAAWYHEQPEVDIKGVLAALSVCLSQGDFTMMMKVLNENLTEGQPAAPAATKAAIDSAESSTAAAAGPSETANQNEAAVAVMKEEVQKVYSKLRFDFKIESLSATLYTGDSELISGVSTRNIATSLARFELRLIAVDGQMRTDTSLDAHVILHNCLLDDTRPGMQAGITRGRVLRMVDRALQQETKSNMIDVSFRQQANQDKHIEVKVSSLYICVCLEYLMAVGDFFVKGLPPSPEATTPTTQTIINADGTKSEVAVAPPRPEAELNIMLSIDRPEIVMVENSMDLNTNALMMDTEVQFKLRQTPDTQSMMGTVKGLQIISCIFAPEKRESSKVIILDPLDVNLISNAPHGKGHHMDISLTDVVLNISPASIKTVVAITSALSPQPTEEEKEKKEAIPKDLWVVKTIADCDLWYLKTVSEADVAEPVMDLALPEDTVPEESRAEQLLLNVGKILVKLEAGVGKRTVPMLITEMTFMAEVRDWSSKLYVSAEMSMEVAYYNDSLAVWEPLIEPVEVEGRHRPWELGLEVVTNDELPPPPDEDDKDAVVLPLPKMSISVLSQDVLQLTMSKKCLEVLTNLGKAFGDAYNLVETAGKGLGEEAPYVIQNDSGLIITVKLEDRFKMPPQAANAHIGLMPGDRLYLQNSDELVSSLKEKSIIRTTQDDHKKLITLLFEEYNATRELTIVNAEKRMFNINQRSYPGETWSIIAQTDTSYGCKTVTIRSMIQICNHLPLGIEVYYKMGNDAMGRCGELQPEEFLNIPLEAVYSHPNQLFFKPMLANYNESTTPLVWKNLKEDTDCVLSCEAAKENLSPLYFNVHTIIENVFMENSNDKTGQVYSLHLNPCVTIRNLLPQAVVYTLEGTAEDKTIEAGQKSQLLNACVGKTTMEIRILNYLDNEWRASYTFEANPDLLSILTFEAFDGTNTQGKLTEDLGLHCTVDKGSINISLYCPYWMVNKTGMNISYKRASKQDTDKATDDNVVSHWADMKEPVLFSFKSKAFFAKKKASLKVADSDWSDKFSLDTVGSSGTVSCKFKGYTYEVGVKSILSSNGLTKIIVFTPYYMMVNQAKFGISCCEVGTAGAQWCDVPPGGCVPFWPLQNNKKMQMQAKVKDKDLLTQPFHFNEAHTTLLKLDHELGGIDVDVQVTEAAVVTTFQGYMSGMASALLINHTHTVPIHYKQSGCDKSRILGAQEVLLYSWEDALGEREFIWSAGQQKDKKNDLNQDGIGEFFYDSDTKVYWVSFLDGMQRVLLFTQDLALATIAQQAGELERVEQDIILSLQGLGLSLVNNSIGHVGREVAYLGITSSGVIWEEKKKKRHKALKYKTCRILEAAYERYINEISIGKTPKPRMALEQKIEVDFVEMMMLKPHKCQIRRSFENGIWMQYRSSPHQMQFHAKVHRLQLDNQLPGCVFQTVLAPTPPPKSVAAESVPKPFTELSVMLRKREHSSVMQFKYSKVLIQEMNLKVDQGFLFALVELFATGEMTEEQQLEYFRADYQRVKSDLDEEASLKSSEEQKNFYDDLHFSPLKIHISFSLQGSSGDDKKPTNLGSNTINLFLQSVGVVLTDVQDVVFKLAYFERKFCFYNQSQLTNEIVRHYANQALKQMYVLVLGLDVLGNPFGVIRGVAQGIEDLFYEPYQGAVQGPEEFAEGLALGVRSLFGHAVGGAAGAVGRITGALGKGIATLTLDDDYQKKRREQLNKRPADLKEGLAQGGKGLVMGFVDGVTGIVRKPVEGAKKEGVEGFFKGVGKGLIGVVARPASGVIDFASSSFQGVQRVAEQMVDIHRLRPPRFLRSDGIMRPYVHLEAEGNNILQELEKGKYALTDTYVAHILVTVNGKNILLATNKRVVFVNKGEIFGQWDADWKYTYADLKEAPSLTGKGIQILLKERQKKSFFSSGTMGKIVPVTDSKSGEWIVSRMKDAMADYKG